MTINRGALFWGVALVTAGLTALAVQQGYLDTHVLAEAWRLWPVILIAIGLSLVLSRTPFAIVGNLLAALLLGMAGGTLVTAGPGIGCAGDLPDALERREGTFSGDTAEVRLDLNCGELRISLADGSGWTTATGIRGGGEVEVRAVANSLRVDTTSRAFEFGGGRQRWEIELGSDPAYDLRIGLNAGEAQLDLAGGTFSSLRADPNAGSLRLDLSGADVDEMRISMNAGEARIQTGADTALAGSVSMNAGSLKLCLPTDAAVRLRVGDNVAFSHNLDNSGLNRSGDTWTSASFAEGGTAVDLRIEGNAASLELNPEGGCA